jgi:hypothetical protein
MPGYLRFGAMIATSVVVMFALKYLSTFQLSHVRFSETRAYMALMMGAAMAVIMLSYMLGMYRDRTLNLAIYLASAAVLAVFLWLLRSQSAVDDVDYMKAMIPHHSIAILTSERARITESARARAGRRNHRHPAPRDRRDGAPHRRHRGRRLSGTSTARAGPEPRAPVGRIGNPLGVTPR